MKTMRAVNYPVSLLIISIFIFAFTGSLFAQAPAQLQPLDKQSMTRMVKDYCLSDNNPADSLKSASELLKALEENKISSADHFKSTFENVLTAKIRSDLALQDTRDFASSITSITKTLPQMDSALIKTDLNEHSKGGMLFQNITSAIPETYKKTLELCKKFNPQNKTNDHKRLSSDIDEYLEYMAKTEPVKYALKITDSTIKDLKDNWFGAGLGFEHVFAGEVKGSSVSGYHFWYTFYEDERNNSAWYGRTLEGFDDPCIFTGQFQWDPDGNGNKFKKAYKRKGGFVTQSSPESILALGHIALEVAKKNNCPSAFKFRASVNDGVYLWQVFTVGRSIRSLYPMVIKSKNLDHQMSEAKELVVDHIMEAEFNK
jgi:poly(U)-specific endoribonuclease